jgi:hypothetical protein
VKKLLTQNVMGVLFFLFYLGTSLISHLHGNYGRSVALTYSMEIIVCSYEAYEFDRKCCISLFKDKLVKLIEFAKTPVYKMVDARIQ